MPSNVINTHQEPMAAAIHKGSALRSAFQASPISPPRALTSSTAARVITMMLPLIRLLRPALDNFFKSCFPSNQSTEKPSPPVYHNSRPFVTQIFKRQTDRVSQSFTAKCKQMDGQSYFYFTILVNNIKFFTWIAVSFHSFFYQVFGHRASRL